MLERPTEAAGDRLRRLWLSACRRLRGLCKAQGRSGLAVVMTHWTAAAIAATAAADHAAVRWLASIAAAKTAACQGARRAQRDRAWAEWLKGGDGGAARCAPLASRRAFAFLRGPAGWLRSPVGDP
eukprot:10034705-Lingulodinium_polyedra.AAC.1